jgi:hypothetical protein
MKKSALKTFRISVSVLLLSLAAQVFGSGTSIFARTVSAVSYTPTVAYDFAGNSTDAQNNSTLTFLPSCTTSANACNASSNYGTDSEGTYWQWTASRGRGGGFLIDTNTAVNTAYSIALKISFGETNCYKTVIDFSDGTDDDHLYFCGGLEFYPRAQSTFQFSPNTVYDILISRQADGKILSYVLDSSGNAVKILEVDDKELSGNPAHSLMIPAASPSGGSRLRFFHDECCEYTTSGKVYDVRIWANQVLPPQQFGLFGNIATTTTSTTTTTTTTLPVTTTSTPRVVEIEIQAPVTTIATGQASVATISPTSTIKKPTTATTVDIQSPTSSSIPPSVASQSTTSETPEVPKLDAGEGAVNIDGKTTKQTLVRKDNQLQIQSGNATATLSSTTKSGVVAPLDRDGNLRLQSGDILKISIGGFRPGSKVGVWFFSTPIKLGTAVVKPDGTVTATFRVPSNIDNGAHRVAVVAELADGKPATFTLGVVVGKLKTTSTLTRMLIAIPIFLAIFLGLLLPNRLRRRRTTL